MRNTPMAKEAPPGPLPAGVTLSAAQRRRGILFLGIASAGVGYVMATQLGLNENFLVELINVTPLQKGLLESARETCGLTALLVLALLAGFAEPLVAAGMLALLACGMAGYGLAPSYAWVVVMSLVWSQGLHVWMPLPNSMTLALAEPGRKGFRLGQIRSAGAIGSALGLAVAFTLSRLQVPMPLLFVMAGGVGLLAAAACLGMPRQLKTPGPRLVFRRKYRLFYILSFLEGWRKQIFICFAAFLLVKQYHTELTTMLMLWGTVQVIGYFASAPVGRLVDHLGERKILVFYFAGLALFFLGYGTITNRYILYGLFVVDSAFFVFVMALTTYVGKIAPPNEHTATLSMGVAMDHVAAVSMPFLGGIIWKFFGYQWVFVAGAVVALISIVPALCLPKHTPVVAEREQMTDDDSEDGGAG